MLLFPRERYRMLKKFRHRRADALEHRRERRTIVEPRDRIDLEQVCSARRLQEISLGEVAKPERTMRSTSDIRYRLLIDR